MAKAKKSKKKVKRDLEQEFINSLKDVGLDRFTRPSKPAIPKPIVWDGEALEPGDYKYTLTAYDKTGKPLNPQIPLHRWSDVKSAYGVPDSDDEMPHYASMDDETLLKHLEAIMKVVSWNATITIRRKGVILP